MNARAPAAAWQPRGQMIYRVATAQDTLAELARMCLRLQIPMLVYVHCAVLHVRLHRRAAACCGTWDWELGLVSGRLSRLNRQRVYGLTYVSSCLPLCTVPLYSLFTALQVSRVTAEPRLLRSIDPHDRIEYTQYTDLDRHTDPLLYGIHTLCTVCSVSLVSTLLSLNTPL